MKVNNLLKKVGSVITTAALLATLGTTAFADGGVTVGVNGDGISITKVETVKHADSADVYDVTVTYKTTKDNAVGMTMLVYKNKDDSSLNDNAANPYTEGSMQIIGIDQTKAESSSDGSAKEGSFTFSVTTNAGTTEAPNVYHIKKGKKALIAVSGDKCTPAYAALLIKLAAKEITPKTLDKAVSVAANASDVDIQSALNAAAEKATVSVIDDVDGEHQVSLSHADIKDGEWALGEDGKYTKTYTFRASNTYVEGVEFKEDKTVKVTATITKTAVSGTVAKLGSAEVTGNVATISVNNSVLKDATDLSNLTTYLEENYKSVQLTAGDLTDTIENGASFETSDAYEVNKTSYTYTATVNAGTGKNGNVKLDANQPITVTVNITSDSITDVKLMKDSAEVTGELDSVQVPSGTTEANVPNEVKNLLSDYSLSYTENKNGASATKTIALTDNKVGYTSAVKDGKVTFTINTIDGIALVSPFSVVVPYTIAPAGVPVYLGDVDLDGEVTPNDLNVLRFHIAGRKELSGINAGKENAQFKAANIVKAEMGEEEEVGPDDYNALRFHIAGRKELESIGKEIVATVPSYVE